MKLADVQALFHGVLRGEVTAADARVAQSFVSDARLSGAQRLEVYGDMYVGRQVEALQAEFPMVHALLGECAFTDLSREYICAHPSEHPDIGQLGRKLADFIRAHAGVRGDLAELAQLERARSLAFASRDVAPRTWEELTALGAERFAMARLQFVPALRTLEVAHDVPELWKALQKGEQPAPSKLEAPVMIAIWKQGFDVFHAPLSSAEAQAVQLARGGSVLGEVCEVFAGEADPASAAFEAIASWFNEGWVAQVEAGAV